MTHLPRFAHGDRTGGPAAPSAWSPPDACRPGQSHPERVPVAQPAPGDRGSVTPLIIGMLICLLLLTAGVTAAGSAFLAGQRLQRLCDGAVAAAVGAADPRRSPSHGVTTTDPITAANQYLRLRGPDVGAVIDIGADTINARCSNQAPITFGVLFGSPTLARTVTSTSQPILKHSALGTNNPADQPDQHQMNTGPEGTPT